jgi:anti-anti-sigma regulatory factor
MKFFLIVAKGSKQGMPIPVTVDLFLIGSDRICQLRKSGLGAKHCALVTRDKKVFVRDMDSGESTLVNGSAIPTGSEWPLHAGDRISVGPLDFLIQFREHNLSKKDLEEWAMSCLDETEEQEEEDPDSTFNTAQSAAQSILNKLNAMKGQVKGRLRIGTEKNITTIRFNDWKLVDESEIASIKQELCDNLNKANMRCLLDLKNVRRLSSQAVIMLSDVFRWVRSRGSVMAVCRIRPELESAMAMLQVEKIRIFKDKKTAISSKW